MDIKKALTSLSQRNGSELFVTVGYPPCFKVGKELIPATKSSLSAEHIHKSMLTIMGEPRYQTFLESMESNYAFDLENVGRFRISAFFQKGEPGMVIRCIKNEVPTLETLGLPEVLGDEVLKPKGLILFTGAAGTGKTTSMAALVNHRNQHSKGHIISIEDPIEFTHTHKNCIITQREVGLDTSSYEEALANALRQAPDLLVVGEIRSTQVMARTLEAVDTGHLCIATMHANNSYQAFERILNFFPPNQHSEILLHLSMSLRAIVGQQLVPSKDKSTMHAIHEVLLNTPRMADLIKAGRLDEMNDLIERSGNIGMQTVNQSLFKLVQAGQISHEQAMLHGNSSNDLRLMVKLQEPLEGKSKPGKGMDDFRLMDD